MEYVCLAGSIILLYMNNDFISEKYAKFRKLNNMVATQQNSKIMVFLVSCQMMAESYYLRLSQYLNKSVRKLDKNLYEISYVIEGKTYKMIVSPTRGPPPILKVSTDTIGNITNHILEYCGPKYDWHGNKFTPEFFGHKQITVEFADGTINTFTYDEHLRIN
jgi:hypothetical protein